MRAPLLSALLVLALGGPVLAASEPPPDEAWSPYPLPSAASPAPVEPVSATPVPVAPSPAAPSPATAATPKASEAAFSASLFGARSLGEGAWGVGGVLGYPLVSARLMRGMLPWLDVGVGVDSFYGLMTDLHLHARAQLVERGRWALAGVVEGGYAFFVRAPQEERRGARYYTGRRNWNVLPGLVASYQRRGAGAMRLFLDVRYHLAIDTEPIVRAPLGGVGEGAEVSSNFPLRLGFEVPFSTSMACVIMVGGDFHGRSEDSTFMPTVGVGLAAAL
ncbi:hypothetical protein P2318_06465 [Myxococcaceae bacterium GXIMD 01537]